MKKVTVFFDLEGWWESPVRPRFDVVKTVSSIVKVLDKYNVKAVFNTCGKIVEDYPDLVLKLSKEGHEIASHGYLHEVFNQLSHDDLDNVLEKTENIIKKIIGEKPIGIRSPGLIFNDTVYDVFRSRGYKWVSNRNMQFCELFNRPDKSSVLHSIATIGSKFQNLFYPKKPYKVNGLLEIPLQSSLETDLLGIVSLEQKSSEEWLTSAFNGLKKQYLRSHDYFNLNFHPWLIGTQNRLRLLNDILGYIHLKEAKFVLAGELLE
ncbi:polysaccharide deacetylase family protein [Candidatus Pacearchaeota archaeon]|nr:polysaccharide deacetylase family protein [Candidatus Pacearchaeota archaeon]